MLVPMSELLQPARTGRYAVGSFNVWGVELAAGVLDAAVEKRSPVILAILESGPGAAFSMELMFSHCAELAKTCPVPVALILDHGRSLDAAVRAIKSGATAVMVDASTKPFEENVAILRETAKIAHMAGVSCEGEIGHVGSGAEYARIDQDSSKWFTQPADAIAYIQQTGVDALAVAVGTAHGEYSSAPKLAFDLLAELGRQVSTPLVLHGGSGTGDENLCRASKLGVAKVNIGTDMVIAARGRIETLLAAGSSKAHISRMLAEARLGFKEISGHYMDVFGSAGKA
jgi:fructose-bisphosphate aldolase, class II